MSRQIVASEIVSEKTDDNLDADAVEDYDIPQNLVEYGREIVKILSTMIDPDAGVKKGKDPKMLVPISYTRYSWVDLTPYQRKKTVCVWNELSQAKRDVVMKAVCSLPRTGAGAATISPNTNKNDRARLLHLYCDASLSSKWTGATQVKDRLTLDDKENPKDFYGQLADAFNNYVGYPYRNATAMHSDETPLGDGPLPGLDTAYEMCKELNPSAGLSTRPSRGGEWIISAHRDFKVDFTKAMKNYKLSGNHDAADPYEEFAKFCFGSEVIMYAFVLFQCEDGSSLNDLLGKLLPDSVARDTGILSPHSANTTLTTTPGVRTGRAPRSASSVASVPTAVVRTVVLEILLDDSAFVGQRVLHTHPSTAITQPFILL